MPPEPPPVAGLPPRFCALGVPPVGRVDAQGRIAGPRQSAHEELRLRAAALGADAVIKLADERRYHAPPPAGAREDRVEPGDPYPDLIESFRPGFFGYEGDGFRTVGGYYWAVSGLAIAYD